MAKHIEQRLVWVLLLFTMSMSLMLPLVMEMVEPFAFPSASYSILIKRFGKLEFDSSSILSRYWSSAVDVEIQYPLPAVLLSTLDIVTGIPEEFLPFIPITALANIIFFVLAKRLFLVWDGRPHRIISVLYYTTSIFVLRLISGQAIGRAVLGVTFLAYFLFSYLLNLSSQRVSQRSTLIIEILFTLAIGFTYYTSQLGILILTLIAPIIARILIPRYFSVMYVPVIPLTAIFMIIHQPLFSILARGADLRLLLNNILEYLKAILKIERETTAYYLQVGYVEIDLLSRMGSVWFLTILKLLTTLATIYVFIKYLPLHRNTLDERKRILWIYSVVVLLLGLSELPYSLLAPTISLRFLSVYGFIIFLYLLYIINSEHRVTNKIKLIIRLIILGMIIISYVGSLLYSWLYGVAKPLGYQKISSLAEFCTSYSSNSRPMIIVTDAYYSVAGFFYSIVSHKYASVAYEPLGSDSIKLYKSLITGDIELLLSQFQRRGAEYLALVNDSRPLWGDAWGYAVSLKSTSIIEAQFSRIYDSGLSVLLKVIST